MPERRVDKAWTDRQFFPNALFSGDSAVYDAATMQLRNPLSFAILAATAALCAPAGAQTADPAATRITLTATRAVGTEAVKITGSAPAARPLEASLYATFSRDLPTVLLSRRSISTDATGRYDATLPIAPGFFRNAILTVVVDAVPAGNGARTTVIVGAPNVSAPPDDIPASVH
jgi:hypothetical protein